MMHTKKIILAAALSLAVAQQANAHEVYAKAGFLGAGGGYGYRFHENFGVRAEFTKFKMDLDDESSGDFDYDGRFKSDHKSLFIDYFPFGGTFRLTAGLAKRDFGLKIKAKPSDDGYISIGGTDVDNDIRNKIKNTSPGERAAIKNQTGVDINALDLDGELSATGALDWKKTSPYLGFGWGNSVERGLGFMFDLGVYVGKPTVKLSASRTLTDIVDAEAAYQKSKGNNTRKTSNEAINEQINEFNDDVKDFKLIPALHIGLSYRF